MQMSTKTFRDMWFKKKMCSEFSIVQSIFLSQWHDNNPSHTKAIQQHSWLFQLLVSAAQHQLPQRSLDLGAGKHLI